MIQNGLKDSAITYKEYIQRYKMIENIILTDEEFTELKLKPCGTFAGSALFHSEETKIYYTLNYKIIKGVYKWVGLKMTKVIEYKNRSLYMGDKNE